MHELAITEGILAAAVPAAEKAGAKRILEIHLRIGELSGVLPECIREYLSIAAEGTIAEGAVLISEPIPIRIRCRTCGEEHEVTRGAFACPSCGSEAFEIISGREYFVDSLKVE